MQVRSWIVGNLMGWGLLACSSGWAIAQMPPAEPEPMIEPTPPSSVDEESPAAADDLQTYTLPRNFSLQIPEEWTAEGAETERSAVITSYDPERLEVNAPQPTDIRTEITFVEEHPDSFVDREIAAIVEQEYPVQRYLPVKINDRTGLRLWVADLPLDYTHQIITFVGYASYGTAMIVTYYNGPADAAETDALIETEALIEQVHNSFELLF
ncbi:MAG: hypothetical protein F6J95_003115 [Leptolyngbya sp. SIO1E4]|nr:hypothetical protein [Leptolyngbya sp. SIO1E4]